MSDEFLTERQKTATPPPVDAVMLLLPVPSWSRLVTLARKLGMSPEATLAMAVSELEKQNEQGVVSATRRE